MNKIDYRIQLSYKGINNTENLKLKELKKLWEMELDNNGKKE